MKAGGTRVSAACSRQASVGCRGPETTVVRVRHSARIADWLEKLGMPEYGECFAGRTNDLSVLPHVTDQDLKDIGVPLGIGGRCWRQLPSSTTSIPEAGVPASGSSKTTAAVASISPLTPEAAGERGDVTVMFSDLVGSTTLSRAHGPGGPPRDDFGLSEVRRGDRAPVRRFRTEILGDGVLVYFGYRKLTRMTPSGRCGLGWS